MFNWIKPHDGGGDNDTLVRCSCGRVMWLKTSSMLIKRHHLGHQMRTIQDGSVWEFFKMKTGLLRRRTFDEWIRDLVQRRGKE